MRQHEKGVPVAEYRVGPLPLRARLELFCTVCDAVQHGHQKGVIHRDLKPGNILVDAAGSPLPPLSAAVHAMGRRRASDRLATCEARMHDRIAVVVPHFQR